MLARSLARLLAYSSLISVLLLYGCGDGEGQATTVPTGTIVSTPVSTVVPTLASIGTQTVPMTASVRTPTSAPTSSLSPQTIKVMKDLDASDKTVTAIGFFANANPDQTQGLLKEYETHTSHFRYELKNPMSETFLARQYGVTQDGTVVFTDGNKRELAKNINEREFTSAILRLLQTGTKTLAFLTGHGECDINAFDQLGYSELNNLLNQDNYATVQWSLATSPTLALDNPTVLVIADPQTPLNLSEINSINGYLTTGGRVLIALDASRSAEDQQKHGEVIASIEKIISRYGIGARDGIVVDFAKRINTADPTVFAIDGYPSDSDITARLRDQPTIFLSAIAIIPPPPTTTITTTVATTLLQTSSGAQNSWLEVIPPGGQPNLQYDPGTTEIVGPITIGVSVETPGESTVATATNAETQTPKTRLVVFGDADFAGNVFVSQTGQFYVTQNGDLFCNAVSWLAGNDLVDITPLPPK